MLGLEHTTVLSWIIKNWLKDVWISYFGGDGRKFQRGRKPSYLVGAFWRPNTFSLILIQDKTVENLSIGGIHNWGTGITVASLATQVPGLNTVCKSNYRPWQWNNNNGAKNNKIKRNTLHTTSYLPVPLAALILSRIPLAKTSREL